MTMQMFMGFVADKSVPKDYIGAAISTPEQADPNYIDGWGEIKNFNASFKAVDFTFELTEVSA